MSVQELVAGLLVLVGVVLFATASIGLLRLTDVYARANAASKAAGLGVVSVLLGVLVHDPSPSVVITLALAIVLQLFTVPIAGVAIAEAAWRSGAPTARGTQYELEPSPDEQSGTP